MQYTYVYSDMGPYVLLRWPGLSIVILNTLKNRLFHIWRRLICIISFTYNDNTDKYQASFLLFCYWTLFSYPLNVCTRIRLICPASCPYISPLTDRYECLLHCFLCWVRCSVPCKVNKAASICSTIMLLIGDIQIHAVNKTYIWHKYVLTVWCIYYLIRIICVDKIVL